MDIKRWQQIETLYYAAQERPETRRTAFLIEACANDEALRQEVEILLAAHREANGFLSSPAVRTAREDSAVSEVVPTAEQSHGANVAATGAPWKRLGSYRLVHEIGRGGMGTVWLAERADGQFRQQVAIKLLHAGAESEEIIHRFRHERQILASLDHPNIARLFDGGTTEDGRPYFVMEYIEGLPIDEYCHHQQLSVDDRLKLFRQVCAAVHYAHQNLVIHRDLKPSNIVVTEDGTPKLLDFGIAKLIQPDLSQSFDTLSGVTPMTPAYASPEQVRGEKLTIASEVYSLGVVLYELLTGCSPYRLKANTFGELMRAVVEQEPERPSIAITRTDNFLGTGLITIEPVDKLRGRLTGDIDSIVLMALRKEPQARYGSVEQFSEDIRHYLEGLPTQARRGTFGYRALKYVRRNKVPVAAAALILFSLVGGIGATLRQARIAKAAQIQAEEQVMSNRQLLYRAQMNLALQDWEANNFGQMVEMLESHLPQAGQEDLRGFEWYYLWWLSHRERFTMRHPERVNSLAFSPDGKLLATGCVDQAARLWDVATGRELATFKGYKDAVSAVHFSPSGDILAAASSDHIVKLWDVTTQRELKSFEIYQDLDPQKTSLLMVKFLPDGQKLAIAASYPMLKLWDAATGQSLTTFSGHTKAIACLAVSPDGRRLATGSNDHTVKLWDAATGRELIKLNAHPQSQVDGVQGLAFSPDGKILASAGGDSLAKLWNAPTGKELRTLRGHTHSIEGVEFSPDGRRLATAGVDRTIRLWDVATGQELDVLRGHSDAVLDVAFSPDGKWLATGRLDRTARLWTVAEERGPTVIKAHADRVLVAAFSPDGKTLATGSADQTIKLWDAATGRERDTLRGHTGEIWTVAFAPDGKQVASGSYDQTVKVWDVATGQESATFKGYSHSVYGVAFAPDGKRLASANHDETAKLWDVATGRELFTLRGHVAGKEQAVRAVAFSPDGKTLATCSRDTTVKLWDAAGGSELATLRGHTAYIRSIAFSPDGRRLASTGYDGIVKLWDVASRRELFTLKGHGAWIYSVAFSPDGKRLASGSYDQTIKIWDATRGQELITLKGHTGYVYSVAFSPDGKTLASASSDGTVRLWHAATEEEVSRHLH